MKIIYLLFIACTYLFFSSCREQKKDIKTTIKVIPIKIRDGLWWRESGVYVRAFEYSFTLCEYEKKMKRHKISMANLDFFLKNNLISKITYKHTQGYEIGTPVEIDYKKKYKNQNEVWNDSINIVYYQINDLGSKENSKKIGKLYQFANTYTDALGGGSIYLSDTTDIYGWFIVETPVELKSPSYFSKPVLKNLKITSLDKRAENICGEYEKISHNTDRFVKDEEVNKNK